MRRPQARAGGAEPSKPAGGAPRRPSQAGPRTWLDGLAAASLLYPLVVAVALYGQWLFAWSLLGHMPRPMLDDPKTIAGLEPTNVVTGWLLLGFLPGGAVAALLQSAVSVRRRERPIEAATRISLVVIAWGAVIGLFAWDPGRVFEWWLD